jgi:hypothetical protein
MLKGQSDPRQVLFASYEARCTKIVKEISAIQIAKYFESASGYESLPHYKLRIPHPTSFADVKSRIEGLPIGKTSKKSTKYVYLNDFALDVRRIVGNSIRFNYQADSVTKSIRKEVLKVLWKFESLWLTLLKEIDRTTPNMYFTQPLPELKYGLLAYEELVKQTSHAGEGVFAVDAFIDPVSVTIQDPVALKGYLKVVSRPLSFGEILSKLIECEYDVLDELMEDVDLIVNNCSNYWSLEINAEGGGDYIKVG